MTKDVFITIEGLQLGSEEEPVILKVPGTYQLSMGTHYIQYEEKHPENEAVLSNIIKIEPSQVTLSKKGEQITQMAFDLKEITQAIYQTAYGDLQLEIKTEAIHFHESQDKLELKMSYSLLSHGSHLSDNVITINIISYK